MNEEGSSSHVANIQGNPSLFEEGSSSHIVNIQEISEVETEQVSPEVNQSFQNLFNSIKIAKDRYIFSPIYVIPTRLREVSPSSYTPKVLSIGPFHKGYKSLKSMEYKKVTMLTQLLSKVGEGSEAETFEKCMQKVMSKIKRIKGYYFGKSIKCSDVDLVQMMVIDGCFILEFIKDLSLAGNEFSNNRLRSRNIALDLVLLENQIPFFVLVDIYNFLTIDKSLPRPPLITMLKVLLDHINPFEEPLKNDLNVGPDTSHYHILGLLHKFYKLPTDFELPVIKTPPTAHSAVELDKVGVKIMPNKDLTWPMAMKFESSKYSHRATFTMPVVRIDHFFEVVLRNLIAYEQYSPVDNYVTSYVMAMDMLVATPADIAKLGKSHVIVSHLGSVKKYDFIDYNDREIQEESLSVYMHTDYNNMI